MLREIRLWIATYVFGVVIWILPAEQPEDLRVLQAAIDFARAMQECP